MINLQFSEGQLSLKSQILFDKIFCAEKSMFAVHSINEVTSKSNNVIRYSIRIALTKELYLYFHKSIKETLKISQPIVTTNRKFEFILIRFNWNGFLNNFFFCKRGFWNIRSVLTKYLNFISFAFLRGMMSGQEIVLVPLFSWRLHVTIGY